MRALKATILGGISLGLPAFAEAGPVSGSVKTITRPGTPPANAIVYAERMDAASPRQSGKFTLTQRNTTFQPHVVAIPAGSTVDFPNDDTIFHNVFSLSGPQPFDLGLYRAGDTRSRTFVQPATYRVFCNIHPQMSALIVVVSTPHVVVTGLDGRFSMNLPEGRYRLTAMSERASPVSVEITSGAGATAVPEIALDESAWVAARHKNKFGKDYPAASYKKPM
jgi:plastocyanin